MRPLELAHHVLALSMYSASDTAGTSGAFRCPETGESRSRNGTAQSSASIWRTITDDQRKHKDGDGPPHPGAFIRSEAIEELGLSVSEAARILGVRRATLSDLVNGNASLSPEMAMRVEKAFGLSMDLLLRMQAWHDATQMRVGTCCTGRENPAP